MKPENAFMSMSLRNNPKKVIDYETLVTCIEGGKKLMRKINEKEGELTSKEAENYWRIKIITEELELLKKELE